MRNLILDTRNLVPPPVRVAPSKVKCDGVTPACGRCRNNRECVWYGLKKISARMTFDELSHRSTPSTTECRYSDYAMLTDPWHSNANNDERPIPGDLIDENNYVLSTQGFLPAVSLRPFQHSLSFGSATSLSSLTGAPHTGLYLQTDSGIHGHRTTFTNSAQPIPSFDQCSENTDQT